MPTSILKADAVTEAFDVDQVISKTREYLVPQGPLKEFVAQNPLRGFMHLEFHEALRRAAATWGAWSYLPLGFYRSAYARGGISETALRRSLEWSIDDIGARERARSDLFEYPEGASRKPQSLVARGIRCQWQSLAGVSVIDKSSAVIYRLLGAYLDQGISIWRMPGDGEGFLQSVGSLVNSSLIGYEPLNQPIAKALLSLQIDQLIETALKHLVGDQSLYESYVVETLLSFPGWSSTVDFIERNPDALLLSKKISLKEILALTLVLDLAFLESASHVERKSLSSFGVQSPPIPMSVSQHVSRVDFIKLVWHEAWEWTLYEKSLALISKLRVNPVRREKPQVQALFCIDDRECSLRRYLETEDPRCETYGLPGFFGVDFMYQCATDISPTRHAPIVLQPKHLIMSKFLKDQIKPKHSKSEHFAIGQQTHSIVRGWFMTQIIGITAAFRLALSVFRPRLTQATASSLSRVNENIEMNLERLAGEGPQSDGFLHGFSPQEMAEKLSHQLKAIGLVKDLAPLVVLIAHGSSSTNNTHFSAYDCGACSGKPGTPNARAFAKMANRVDVRQELASMGIMIPDSTTFVAGLHDTTRDEVKFFDLREVSETARKAISEFYPKLKRALRNNARERCRRFELVDPNISAAAALQEVQRRSVAIFEPRPELTHASNAIAIVGRRSLTAGGFLDRRAFLHSYDPEIDADGSLLQSVLTAVMPVCGGINLNYYFSRLDNEVYGSSSKLPHNIIGLIGVCNGVEGDIQTGLPRQMVEIHDPIRLQLIIEQRPDLVEKVLCAQPNLSVWVENNWMRLMCIHPADGRIFVYRDRRFMELSLSDLPKVSSKLSYRDCYQGSHGNCEFSQVVPGGTHGT